MIVELSMEAIELLDVIRSMRDYFSEEDDGEVIFRIMLDWIKKENDETVTDFIREFF